MELKYVHGIYTCKCLFNENYLNFSIHSNTQELEVDWNEPVYSIAGWLLVNQARKNIVNVYMWWMVQ